MCCCKAEEEADQQALEAEQQAVEAGRAALNLEGYMEKKSPTSNRWLDRWFKLTTRIHENEAGDFTYTHTILWYKRKGGSVTKALDAKGIWLVSAHEREVFDDDMTHCVCFDACAVGCSCYHRPARCPI